MTKRAAAALRTCRRCGRQGHAAFRLVDRLPSGERIWECSVPTACGRKRQLVGAPTGRGRSPSTAAARSTLPPTVVVVTDDAALRARLAGTIRQARVASMRAMSVARAVRSVTWVVARPPDVLVIDAERLQMAARNGLQRAARAASGAGCQLIVLACDGGERQRWSDALASAAPLVIDAHGDRDGTGHGSVDQPVEVALHNAMLGTLRQSRQDATSIARS
jgi:hypothetical protein